MEREIVLKLAIFLGIVIIGGAVGLVLKFVLTDEGKKLKNKFIEGLQKGSADDTKQNNKKKQLTPHNEIKPKNNETSKHPNTELKQQNSELSKKAKAIDKQEPATLEKYGFPSAEDILKVEAEEERLRETYNTIRDITQLYLERMGIRDILQSIAEMAVYIPQGLREYDEVKQILPLHVSVWNTSVNTLKRQTAKLFLKYEQLMQLEKETELADIETKTEELLKNVRTAWDEYRKNRSQENEWKLRRAVEAYPARKTAAEESLRTYGMAVSEEKKADVLALCRDLKELMDSETFCSLETYEIQEGEKVSISMNGEELYLDPTTKAYWDKVGFFAAKIQDFFEKWDCKFKS